MSKFTDYTNKLTDKFNSASKGQKIGIGVAAAVGAVVFHPALIAGGLVTAAIAAGGVAVGGTEAVDRYNKKYKGPKQ